eukprot:403334668
MNEDLQNTGPVGASVRNRNSHSNFLGPPQIPESESLFQPHNQQSLPLKGKIRLLKDDQNNSAQSNNNALREIGTIQLEEVEPISNQYFGQLIIDSFAQDRGVIVGRIQTRDRVHFKRSFYHDFYAPNLIKLLFKTPFLFTDEVLISRYHPTIPLTVRNPLTNEIIVGEVEFYLVSKEQKQAVQTHIEQADELLSQKRHSNNNPMNNSGELELTAKYIGSDFNYATQQEFRQSFLEYSMEQEHAKMQLGGEINKKLANNNEFQSFARQIMRGQSNGIGPRAIWNMIQHRKKTICFHGAVLCFYVIAAITTFVLGAYGFSQFKEPQQSDNTNSNDQDYDNYGDEDQQNKSSNDENQMNFNIFTYTLPFVAFILDHSTKRIKNLNEKSIFVFMKVLLIIYYLGAYVLALQNLESAIYFIICNVNFLVFPVMTCIYGYYLRKNKFG